MDAPSLLRRDEGPVAALTLNRPERRNALSLALLAALQEAFDAIASDAAIRAVTVTGAGSAFCSGHDLEELIAAPAVRREAFFARCSRLMATIARLPKPTIASVNGPASAAGCQLVASCDLAVACEEARFATPGVDIGLFCSTPAVALARAIAPRHALEMLLTGEAVPARRALETGLVNRVVPAAELEAATRAMADKVAAKSPAAIAVGKDVFHRQLTMPLDEAYACASRAMAENMAAPDAAEGIGAFLEKRRPLWPGP